MKKFEVPYESTVVKRGQVNRNEDENDTLLMLSLNLVDNSMSLLMRESYSVIY